jgi:carbamoyl-phosphate synthase large subunit
VRNILILGSGGLRVGQAGEFDYSGSQAIKAFKEEGYRTILLNPNIATLQTDADMADVVYFLPLQHDFALRIIEKEQIHAIALGFGGQTALNLGLELASSGALAKYELKVLGSSIATIKATEDRDIFRKTLEQHKIKTPRSKAATTVTEALAIGAEFDYPLMLRSAFSLGGLGSGKVVNAVAMQDMASKALSLVPQILLEEYLQGWKEFEYEIVRDSTGNSLTICNMENLDPMGIHTGESIVIAPAQTLNDEEHQNLRNIALSCAQIFQIVGECNIQFAVNPANGDYRVIEMNPRLSRSSALASKATGYPLAFVAAKLCLGITLPQLRNPLTQKTTAFFEPALDYVVVKIPRWDTNKLSLAERTIGTEMKSVGEVMGIGRSFPEALHKAVQMLNIGVSGLQDCRWVLDNLAQELEFATDRRIFALFQWFYSGKDLAEAFSLSKIDLWFLSQIQEIAQLALQLKAQGINQTNLLQAKLYGFSDAAIACLGGISAAAVRQLRLQWGITPVIKQIDTLAGEFAAATNYVYMTYHGQYHDVVPSSVAVASAVTKEDTYVILGSGPYTIGSSVEFDWCTVNLARALRKAGKHVIIINSNPETVSTDYDESERLYFEPLTLERVCDILDFEQVAGVCVSVGGQIANNLALPLAQLGYPLLGTAAANIDQAEDRVKFSALLNQLEIDQPYWTSAANPEEIAAFIAKVGFPVLIRPSYVLSGAAMKVVFNQASLNQYLAAALLVSDEHPVVISQFIENAKELEIDGIAQNGRMVIDAISEHIENAGVHSGDATLIFPPERLYVKTVNRARDLARKIIKALNITGPFNLQFIARNNELKVIECNVRAARSFPFISKVSGHNLIAILAQVLTGVKVKPGFNTLDCGVLGIKSPVFSYNRFKGSDPVAQVEMSSTGEVASMGKDLLETFYLSWLGVGQEITKKLILLSIADQYKQKLLPLIHELSLQGWQFLATGATHELLVNHGIQSRFVFKISDQVEPNVAQVISQSQVGLIINLPAAAPGTRNLEQTATHNSDGFKIRRLAIDYHIPLVTNFQLSEILLQSLAVYYQKQLALWSYQELHASRNWH